MELIAFQKIFLSWLLLCRPGLGLHSLIIFLAYEKLVTNPCAADGRRNYSNNIISVMQ